MGANKHSQGCRAGVQRHQILVSKSGDTAQGIIATATRHFRADDTSFSRRSAALSALTLASTAFLRSIKGV